MSQVALPRCASLALLLAASAMQAQSAPVDTLRTRGLSAPVEVRRDRWGVPHIYARSQHDLFFAQGFTAAQDRLFQMEMWRRAGEGRLSEVLGPRAVRRDRFARLFSYRGNMAREWAAYGPDTKAIVTAFVAGVNAYIAQAGDELPPEFGMLGFKPEPWAITVPLVRATGLSGVSNGSAEVLRAQLVAALGVQRTEELMPTDPVRALDPAAGLDLAGIDSTSLGGFASAFADVAYNRIEGSNNWVVNGRKSATGKPLLANDPHRVITNPAVRYLTHLVAPGWNVIGAGEPAAPGVAIGHNERVAFGLTVVGMDQQDLYVETLLDCPRAAAGSLGCVQTARGVVPITAQVDTIRVKGEAPRVVTLQFTSHGPLVAVDSARKRGFAIRSVHSEPGTASYLGSLALDRAHNWREFETAMTRWLMPSENMIYADVDGNIGWIAAGLMPKRSWSGLLPVPGTGSHEWSGFVPGRALPRAYNPASGFINTSNNNILPDDYTTPIAYEWASRYRADRVREVLRDTRQFSVEDFARLQHDDKSLLAEALMPALRAAATRQQALEQPRVRQLLAWDLHMSREQVAPTVFEAWAPALFKRVMARQLADNAPLRALLSARPDYDWLEAYAVKHAGSATLDSMVLGALADIEPQLRALAPDGDEARLRWGTVHTARFRHPLSSRYDLPPASRSGDANTVNATGGANFAQTAGASFREVIDLADFDRSVVTNVPGQSSDPRSPHYGDLLTLWGKDQHFPLVYSRKRVEQETERVTWLVPQR